MKNVPAPPSSESAPQSSDSPPPSTTTRRISYTTIVLFGILCAVAALAIYVAVAFDTIAALPLFRSWFHALPDIQKENVILPPMPHSPTPKPTPTRLKAGNDTYIINQWEGAKGPKISSLTLAPLDPQKGVRQTLSVHLTYPTPIDTASIDYTSDNTIRTLPLTLSEGSRTDGTWSTSWTVDDTILYTYKITIIATASGITNRVIVAPRQ